MAQLVKLRKQQAMFKALDVELISVLREEKDGLKGLKKAYTKTKFSNLLLDSPVKQTSAYSQSGFAVYFIDKRGIIKEVVTGKKYKRPSENSVLDVAKRLFK